ncbi:hypothetical protein M758_1G032900 [Ceratodon purpureus]|nr:hypothetical protein M758_1G032900 [Ceratodon purpureus]
MVQCMVAEYGAVVRIRIRRGEGRSSNRASASSSTTRGGRQDAIGEQFGRGACDGELELGRPGTLGRKLGIRGCAGCRELRPAWKFRGGTREIARILRRARLRGNSGRASAAGRGEQDVIAGHRDSEVDCPGSLGVKDGTL